MAGRLRAMLGHEDDGVSSRAGYQRRTKIIRLVQTLTRLRRDLRLTQTEVGRRMETTQSAVSAFENIGGDPKLSTVMRYANAVGAEVHFVVARNELRRAPVSAAMTFGTTGVTTSNSRLQIVAS